MNAVGPRIGDRVRRAATEHLEASGPLAEFFNVVAAFADDLIATMEAAANTAKAAVDGQVSRINASIEAADAAAEKARLAVADHKAQTEAALVRLVAELREECGGAMKDWAVVKERNHGTQRIALIVGAGALGATLLIGGGAGGMAWATADARALAERCADGANLIQAQTKAVWCRISDGEIVR